MADFSDMLPDARPRAWRHRPDHGPWATLDIERQQEDAAADSASHPVPPLRRLMRADLDGGAACYGGSASVIDRRERCRMVAGDGASFYLAARRYVGPSRIPVDAAQRCSLPSAFDGATTAGIVTRMG